MVHLAVVVAAVEAHLRRVGPLGRGFQLADLFETEDLGPEPMGFLEVADVEDQMIEARRCDGTGRCRLTC